MLTLKFSTHPGGAAIEPEGPHGARWGGGPIGRASGTKDVKVHGMSWLPQLRRKGWWWLVISMEKIAEDPGSQNRTKMQQDTKDTKVYKSKLQMLVPQAAGA